MDDNTYVGRIKQTFYHYPDFGFYPFTRFYTPVLSIRLSYSVIGNVVKTLSEIFYKVNKEGGKKSKSLRTSMEMGTFGAG